VADFAKIAFTQCVSGRAVRVSNTSRVRLRPCKLIAALLHGATSKNRLRTSHPLACRIFVYFFAARCPNAITFPRKTAVGCEAVWTCPWRISPKSTHEYSVKAAPNARFVSSVSSSSFRLIPLICKVHKYSVKVQMLHADGAHERSRTSTGFPIRS
jgi:hypothetical protein